MPPLGLILLGPIVFLIAVFTFAWWHGLRLERMALLDQSSDAVDRTEQIDGVAISWGARLAWLEVPHGDRRDVEEVAVPWTEAQCDQRRPVDPRVEPLLEALDTPGVMRFDDRIRIEAPVYGGIVGALDPHAADHVGDLALCYGRTFETVDAAFAARARRSAPDERARRRYAVLMSAHLIGGTKAGAAARAMLTDADRLRMPGLERVMWARLAGAEGDAELASLSERTDDDAVRAAALNALASMSPGPETARLALGPMAGRARARVFGDALLGQSEMLSLLPAEEIAQAIVGVVTSGRSDEVAAAMAQLPLHMFGLPWALAPWEGELRAALATARGAFFRALVDLLAGMGVLDVADELTPRLLPDGDEDDAWDVATALERIGGVGAVPALAAVADDRRRSRELRVAAEAAIVRIQARAGGRVGSLAVVAPDEGRGRFAVVDDDRS